MSSFEGTAAPYVPTGLESYVVMRSSFNNDIVPVAVSDTAAGARAVLRNEREKNERWSVDDFPNTLGFTVRKKDGRLLAEFYVVKVPK
jgi:hypothetical protein